MKYGIVPSVTTDDAPPASLGIRKITLTSNTAGVVLKTANATIELARGGVVVLSTD